MAKDWKKRQGTVFSTNPDFEFDYDKEKEQETLLPQQQNLRVSIDKKGRGGKIATLITGFVGKEDDLNNLSKILKTKCGVGGTAKEREIIIQGDFRDRIIILLTEMGYKSKKSGG